MLSSYQRGIFTEWLSRIVLRLKFYSICAIRNKTPVGEIDIIAKKPGIIYLIEIKYRTDPIILRDLLTEKLRQRIFRSYQWWLKSNMQYTSYDVKLEYMLWHGLSCEHKAWE